MGSCETPTRFFVEVYFYDLRCFFDAFLAVTGIVRFRLRVSREICIAILEFDDQRIILVNTPTCTAH